MNTTEFNVLKALCAADHNALTYRRLDQLVPGGTSSAVYALKRQGSVVEIGNGSGYSRVWALTPTGHRDFRKERDQREQAVRRQQQTVMEQAAARVNTQTVGVVLTYGVSDPSGRWLAKFSENVMQEIKRIRAVEPTTIFAKGIASYAFVLPSVNDPDAKLTPVGVFPSKHQAENAVSRIRATSVSSGAQYLTLTKLDMVREVEVDYVR